MFFCLLFKRIMEKRHCVHVQITFWARFVQKKAKRKIGGEKGVCVDRMEKGSLAYIDSKDKAKKKGLFLIFKFFLR